MNIEAMAREAIDICGGPEDMLPHMMNLLALVRAQALEDAAQKVDHYAGLVDAFNGLNFRHCAAAIRALPTSGG